MKFRFYIALWAGKLVDFVLKLKGDTQNDMPGSVIFRLCPDFLKYVKKPKHSVAVTGTNGKSTVTTLIADALVDLGYKTEFLDWGPNLRAGHCLAMCRSVNIFNRPKVDAVVLEADEGTSPYEMSRLQPDVYIVTNICRDSLRRNAHPYYIRDRIQQAILSMPNTKIILNADDPISGLMKAVQQDHVRYIAMDSTGNEDLDNSVLHDFTICPHCHAKPVYEHRHYLQMGRFTCPECGLSSPAPDYNAPFFDPALQLLRVEEKDGSTYTIHTDSSSVFNAFNYLSTVAYLRWLGVSKERTEKVVSKLKVPKSREEMSTVKGIEIHTSMCKGQTGSSASVVFRHLSKIDQSLELILMMNEEYFNPKAHETPSWLYDCDYELLARPNVRFIMAGPMYADYKMRLKFAGVADENIVCIPNEKDVIDHVIFEGIDQIYVLHESDRITEAHNLKEEIEKKLLASDYAGKTPADHNEGGRA